MVYGSGMSREAMPVSPERFDRGRANLGMRVVLRNSNTGFFLSDADDWTADEKLARDFVHTATALLFARREKLIPENVFAPLWVTDFPMFEFHEDDECYYSMHHPFTSPHDEDLPVFERAVNGETELFSQIRAKAYDAVINGVEVAGGSIRIHRRDVQRLVFKALGMTEEMARARFGFFLEALSYGTPPHGGIASGIERTLMVLVPTENIRDVMAFPKTASAQDLMIDAPGEVDAKQLEELHLKIVKE